MDYTLDQIVRTYILENGENESKRFRFLNIAWAAIEELNMDVSGVSTVAELTIDANTCRADLPEDYIQYQRIGVCKAGRVFSLGKDSKLCLTPNTDNCGNPIAVPVARNPQDFEQYVFNGLPLPSQMIVGDGGIFGFGAGNNQNGYYRIDEENGQILFASSISGTIVLEYLSSPKKKGGNFIVHPYCVEALKSFIDWRKIDKRMYLGAWQIARTEYYNQRRLAKDRFNTFTLDEIYQALNKSFSQTVKL